MLKPGMLVRWQYGLSNSCIVRLVKQNTPPHSWTIDDFEPRGLGRCRALVSTLMPLRPLEELLYA